MNRKIIESISLKLELKNLDGEVITEVNLGLPDTSANTVAELEKENGYRRTVSGNF